MNEKELTDERPSPGRPRGESLNTLGSVRRRLAALVRDFEKQKAVDKLMIERLRALVYAYGTLASVVKDSELDDLLARVEALEAQKATP